MHNDVLLIGPSTDKRRCEAAGQESSDEQTSDDALRVFILFSVERVYVRTLQPIGAYKFNDVLFLFLSHVDPRTTWRQVQLLLTHDNTVYDEVVP